MTESKRARARGFAIAATVGRVALRGIVVGLSVFQVQNGGKPGGLPGQWESPVVRKRDHRP